MEIDDENSNFSQLSGTNYEKTDGTASSTSSKKGRKVQNWIPLKSFDSIEEYSDFITTKMPFNASRTSHHATKCKHDTSHTTITELRFCKGHKILHPQTFS